jgi:hypothetical protein
MSVDAFPLAWPIGWPRAKHRARAKFGAVGTRSNDAGSRWKERRQLTMAEGRDRLRDELARLGARQVVISTNVQARQDGLLYASASNPSDPGAAVYFQLSGQPRVLATDRWDRLADNMAAIAGHIEAIRRIDRYGVGSMEQAFAGYRQLSAIGERKPWYVVMGFREPPKDPASARAKYEELMLRHHPDRGGNANQAAEVTAAWSEGRRAMGITP